MVHLVKCKSKKQPNFGWCGCFFDCLYFYRAAKRGASFKERLRIDIDNALSGCRDFEEFLARMRAEGYEVRRRGKSLEVKAQGQERYRREKARDTSTQRTLFAGQRFST